MIETARARGAAAAVGEGHLGVGGGEEGTGLAQPGGVLQAGEAGGDQGR